MERRELLASVCVGCVGAVSGCTAVLPTGSSETEPTETGPSRSGVEFRVEMPAEAAIGQSFEIELVAENFDATERTLSTDVQLSVPGTDTELITTELQIPATGSASDVVTVSSNVLGTVRVTVPEYDIESRTDITPLTLPFGSYATAEAIPELTILKPQVSRYYKHEVPAGIVRVDAPTGYQFVLAVLRARNVTPTTINLPDRSSIVAQVGDRTYEPVVTEVSGSAKFVDPVVGRELDKFVIPSTSLRRSQQIPQYKSRIALFEIESGRLAEGIDIQARWSLDSTTKKTEIRWTESTNQ